MGIYTIHSLNFCDEYIQLFIKILAFHLFLVHDWVS
jgi:hypothetical protein